MSNNSKLNVKDKEYLDWIERNTSVSFISNDIGGKCSDFMQIPLFYGMVDEYFKANHGDKTCYEFGGFYQCYKVKYNGNAYIVGRRDGLCGDYRIARYNCHVNLDDLVDLEDIQKFVKQNDKPKLKMKV